MQNPEYAPAYTIIVDFLFVRQLREGVKNTLLGDMPLIIVALED